MIFDWIEWDDDNLGYATVRATAAEIEQAIWNADRMFPHRADLERVLFGPPPAEVDALWWWPRSYETERGR